MWFVYIKVSVFTRLQELVTSSFPEAVNCGILILCSLSTHLNINLSSTPKSPRWFNLFGVYSWIHAVFHISHEWHVGYPTEPRLIWFIILDYLARSTNYEAVFSHLQHLVASFLSKTVRLWFLITSYFCRYSDRAMGLVFIGCRVIFLGGGGKGGGGGAQPAFASWRRRQKKPGA